MIEKSFGKVVARRSSLGYAFVEAAVFVAPQFSSLQCWKRVFTSFQKIAGLIVKGFKRQFWRARVSSIHLMSQIACNSMSSGFDSISSRTMLAISKVLHLLLPKSPDCQHTR